MVNYRTLDTPMKVLVYGATGTQAGPVVDLLVQQGHEARILTRDPARAAQGRPEGVTAVAGDFEDPDSLVRASRGMDAVSFMIPAFLTHPEKTLEYATVARDSAAAEGVKLMVWNTGGRWPEPHQDRAVDREMRAIGEVLKAGKVPLTVIAPTTYMENLLGPGTREAIRARNEVAYPVLENRRMGWIAARDVSALVVAALERPQFVGRLFRVSGVEAPTGAELAAAFADALGRPFRYRTMTPNEMRAALDSAYGPGAGDYVAEEYALDQADPNPPAKYYEMAEVLRDLPVRMTTTREWISKHAQHFVETRS